MKVKKGISALMVLCLVISIFWGMDYHTEMVMAAESDENVLFEDHFDDDTSLANWTVITSAATLTTDRGFLNHNSTGEVKISAGENAWQDYAFEVKTYNDGWVQLYGRFQDTSDYYSFRYDGSDYELSKNVAGTSTVIATANAKYEIHGWTTYKFAFEGSSIRCYVDGKLIIEETDSTFTQGKIGVRQKWAVLGLDDVVVTKTDSGETLSNDEPTVLVDWKFTQDYSKQGTSIDDGTLVLEDASGNGNDLELITVGDPGNVLEWSDDNYYGLDDEESILFSNNTNDQDGSNRIGKYFRTVDNAPINTENFMGGYTIELVYKLPEEFLRDKHQWMKLLYREGYGESWVGTDGDESVFEMAISNLKEIQSFYFPTNHSYVDTSWSFALDSVEDWYHIALVNDGENTKLYINGVEDFRNATSVMEGIKAVIGNNWDIGAKRTSDVGAKRFLAGNLQEIKITDRAIEMEDWIVPDALDRTPEYGDNRDLPLLNDEGNYNIAFIPDIQKTVRYMNDITVEQMKWIGQNQDDNNIIFTSFLGDIVDRKEYDYEWFNASIALSNLDAYDVPYMVMAGNHDYGSSDVYLDYFGADKFTDRSYYYNDSPSGYSSYSIFEAGSYTYMILALDWEPDNYQEDKEWVQQVLDDHKDIPTIIQSHEILEFKSDNTTQRSARGRNIWTDFVYKNDQVFMTICGHHHGAGHQVSKNAYGHDVLEMVVDYQSQYHGGNGWIRFAEFDEDDNKVHFHTFSPWVESLSEDERSYFDMKNLTGSKDDFEYSIDFETRFNFDHIPVLLYDVNCYYYPSDTNVYSVPSENLMNSVYNQAYSIDSITDNAWGYEMIGNAPHTSSSKTVYTEDPFDSFLATAAKADGIKYTFDLPDGQYWVTLGFNDLYNCYRPINISFNDRLIDTYTVHSAEKDTDSNWITSKEAKTYLAEVDNGQLTILLENRNTENDGPIINFIKIYQSDVLVDKLIISDAELNLDQGQTYHLSAHAEPEDATNKEVFWITSDAKVASVNNTGVVLALLPGEAVITAQSSDGNATTACAVTVNMVEISDIPTGLSVGQIVSDDSIDLIWNTTDAALTYKLYRSNSADGTYTEIYSGTSSSYTDHSLEELTTYYYKVSGVNGGGESELSDAVAITTITEPEVPRGFTGEAVDEANIALNWDEMEGATLYSLYRFSEKFMGYVEIYRGSECSFTDTELDAATTYHYKVSAWNAAGESDETEDLSITTLQGIVRPNTPEGLTTGAAITVNTIDLVWDEVDKVTGYRLYRFSEESGTYVQIYSGAGAYYTDEGLSAQRTYYYKVSAYNSAGESERSTPFSVTTKKGEEILKPDTPTGLTTRASAIGIDIIGLTWDTAENATEYCVYRFNAESGSYEKVYSGVATDFRDSGLEPSTQYYYRVSALNETMESELSEALSATTLVLEAPIGLGVVEVTSSTAELTWKSVKGVTGYRVYRADEESDSYTIVYSGSETGFVDTKLDQLTTYYYIVTAICNSLESEVTEIVSATTLEQVTVPESPEDLAVELIGTGSVTLTWAPSEKAASYKLYRSVNGSNNYSLIYEGVNTNFADTGLLPATTYNYRVCAVNTAGESELSEAVEAITKNSGGSSSNGNKTSDETTSQDDLKENVSDRKIEKIGGKTVETVTADETAIKEKITKVNGAKVTIPASDDADKVVGKLSADLIKQMADTDAVLEVKTDDVSYQLQTSKISMTVISEELGEETSLEDIEFSVQISKVSEDRIDEITKAAQENDQEIIATPVTFDIVCTNNGKEVTIDQFSGYVTRYIAIPDDVDPDHVTTGIVINSDGSFEHVPTTVEEIDGKYYAKISSMTNSTYSIIYHQKSFEDLASHWSEAAVSDMASRLIINGVSQTAFEPDRNITRAEFTTILVRTMGLMRNGEGEECFTDVSADDWYYGAVYMAREYGLIENCESTFFSGEEMITREEVMVMTANAIITAGVDTALEDSDISALLNQFVDGELVSEEAAGDVALCIQNGIINGYNQMINPMGEITRAEAAMLVSRLLEKIETLV